MSWPDERAKQKKEEEDVKSDDEVEHEDKEEDDEVIFVHYEQRKVMLSQLHLIENGALDPATDPQSELRQVRDWRDTEKISSYCNSVLIMYCK